MAKEYYKIPASIDRSILDHKISFSKSTPIPIKLVLFWIGTLFAILLVWAQTPLGRFPLWGALMTALILVFAATFGFLTKTSELKISQLGSLYRYDFTSKRKVLTRDSSDPAPFLTLVGIKEIDDTGIIKFLDGSVGQMYAIVGSASKLIFDEDLHAIIDRVDAFWRKVDTKSEWIFMTTKEPQRVYRQVANLERRNKKLLYRDPELRKLMDKQFDVLTNYVGGAAAETKFNSIHQYLIIKAGSMNNLTDAHGVLGAEVENSTFMFKQCSILDGTETVDALRSVYAGPQH